RLVAGQPVKKESAIAKLTASNAAMDNARAATQVFGGYGFMDESPVARFYRDAKVLEIGEGTSEIQRLVISRERGPPLEESGPRPDRSGGGAGAPFVAPTPAARLQRARDHERARGRRGPRVRLPEGDGT